MLFKKDDDRKISKFSTAWTSDGSGDATVLLADYSGYEIVAVQTVPGEDGDLATDLPTADYNATLIDAYGMDWFYEEGLDRSGTVAEAFCKDGQIPFPDSATLTIDSAGASNQGIVNIWIA